MSVLVVVSSSLLLALRGVAAVQRIAEGPGEVRVLSGDTATLTCRVEEQRGAVTWTKDGFGLGTDRALSRFPRYSMVGSSADGDTLPPLAFQIRSHVGFAFAGEYNLEIRDVELGDDAPYRCQVAPTSEQRGDISEPSRLVVLGMSFRAFHLEPTPKRAGLSDA